MLILLDCHREGTESLEIITDRGTSVAFFTLVLFASTWYYIKKSKEQQAMKYSNKPKDAKSTLRRNA
jgi:hypothetical protein